MNRLAALAAQLTFLAAAAAGIAVLGFDGPHTGTIMFSTFCIAVGLSAVTVVQIVRHLTSPAQDPAPLHPHAGQTRRFMEQNGGLPKSPPQIGGLPQSPPQMGPTARMRRSIEADRLPEVTDRDLPLPMAWPTAQPRKNGRTWRTDA